MENNNKNGFENFRRTPAYKFCGNSFYVLISLLLVFAVCVGFGSTGSWTFPFLWKFIWGLCLGGVGFVVLSFLILIISSIVGFCTKDKYYESELSKKADIGFNFILVVDVVVIFWAIKLAPIIFHP